MKDEYLGTLYAGIMTSIILMFTGGVSAIVGLIIAIPTAVYGIVSVVKDMHDFFAD